MAIVKDNGPLITFRNGGIVSANVTVSVGNNDLIIPSSYFKGKMYTDRPSPSRCLVRRGGPRSTIYCEQFKVGIHTEHVGRSKTGRWYTWSNDE